MKFIFPYNNLIKALKKRLKIPFKIAQFKPCPNCNVPFSFYLVFGRKNELFTKKMYYSSR